MRRKDLPTIPKEVISATGFLKVRYVNKLPKTQEPGKYTAGLYERDKDSLTISILRREPRREKWIIFLHELIHDLEVEGNIRLTEKEIDALSQALFSCFLRNDWKLPGEK